MDEDKVISYTDYMGDLMSSVTDIINVMSYVLIAFVTISLVVSSIMIGVITYISVLERKKEIALFPYSLFFIFDYLYIFIKH